MALGLMQITCSLAHSEMQNIISWHSVEKKQLPSIFLMPSPMLELSSMLSHFNNPQVRIISASLDKAVKAEKSKLHPN